MQFTFYLTTVLFFCANFNCTIFFFSDVALEIVKSDRWKEALRNTTNNNGVIDTPLRKLIRKMPGKCIRIGQFAL